MEEAFHQLVDILFVDEGRLDIDLGELAAADLDPSAIYICSLLYLALFGSVIAFGKLSGRFDVTDSFAIRGAAGTNVTDWPRSERIADNEFK